MIMPQGLAGRIPVRSSVETNELIGILTGLTASTGTEPTQACADWPVVGNFKLCKQSFVFGQQGRMSQVLNIKYAGQVVNRGVGAPKGSLPVEPDRCSDAAVRRCG